MKFNVIDLDKWERKECFNHFMTVAKSTYTLTVNVDVTKLIKEIKLKNYRLYPVFTWIVTKVLNNHTEFKMSYNSEGKLGYYDEICPDYSVLNDKTKIMDTLCTEYNSNFNLFYKNMVNDLENYDKDGTRTKERDNFYIVSCIPWISYSSFNVSNESGMQFLFPMVTWGKYYEEGNRILMPLTLQVHHAVADGYHCSLFYKEIEEIIENIEKYI